MNKTYNKVIALCFALTIIVISAVSFNSCQKEAETSLAEETQLTKNEAVQKLTIGATISEKGYKGSGSGKDKTCVAAEGRCWLWGSAELPNNVTGLRIGITIEIVHGSTANLVLNFSYSNNTMASLDELLGSDRVLVIEEDMIESGDSELLQLIGTTLPCTIPAGSYQGDVTTSGIQVIVPVIY